MSVRHLLVLSTLLGTLSSVAGAHAFWIPSHPGATLSAAPSFRSDPSYCTDGKWIFKGGRLLTATYIENVDDREDAVGRWYEARGWLKIVFRGAVNYLPRPISRPTHRLWLNVSLEPDIVLFNPSNGTLTRVLHRYRLLVCPPTALLRH